LFFIAALYISDAFAKRNTQCRKTENALRDGGKGGPVGWPNKSPVFAKGERTSLTKHGFGLPANANQE
jgi:hypothetical protein